MWDIIRRWFLSIFTKEWWLGEEVPIEVSKVQESESNLKVQIGELETQIRGDKDELVQDAIRLRDYRQKVDKATKEIANFRSQLKEREIDLKRVKIELRRRRKGDTNNQGLLKSKGDKIRILQIKTIRLQKTIEEKDKEPKKKDEELMEKSKKLIAAFEDIDKLKKETLEKDKKIEQLEKDLEGAQKPDKEPSQFEKVTEPTDKKEAPNKTEIEINVVRSLVFLLILSPILIMRPGPLSTTYSRTPDRIETKISIETDTEADIETKAITETEAITEIETKIPLICIDPGHEGLGDNMGTQGIVTHVVEYATNLEISLKLKEVLEDQGMEVIMTREWNEVYIPNQARVRMANKAQADLFLLIHCNGSENPEENGSVVFYPPANKRTEAILERSKEAAHLILDELSKINRNGLGRLSAIYENMDKRVCCGSSYLILKHSRVPVALIEVGYLTNPQEDSLLNSKDYQKKVAAAMSNGVIRYLLSNGWKITKDL